MMDLSAAVLSQRKRGLSSGRVSYKEENGEKTIGGFGQAILF